MKVWTRAEWGARPPRSTTWMETPAAMAVIHHTVTTWPASPDQAAEQCRTIQGWHMDGNGWADIGYSWLVGAGDIFEGRGWGVAQAAQQGYNNVAHSVAILGDGTNQPASTADLEAVAAIIRSGMAFGAIADVRILAHRDLNSTECCGDAVYNQLPRIRELVEGEPVTPTEQVVADLYRMWCLRQGDPEGIRYWANLLDTGGIDVQSLKLRMLADEGWARMVERTGGPA